MTSISGVEDTLPAAGSTAYTHTVNRLAESTGAEPAQYAYDNVGNIISDGTRTFTYNQRNRLSRVSEGTTSVAEYGYDGRGRRVSKTVSGVTTYFHYDLSGNLIAETTAAGTPLRDIIHQDGERIAMKVYGSGAGTYWFINDHLGAPRVIVNSSGQVVWKAAYLPFGKAEVLIDTIENNFRLPSQYFDAETGFHYNMFRYYDPDTGRYITADPIGLSGGLNLFAYAGGDPVNFIDPDGLEGIAIGIGVGAGSSGVGTAIAVGAAQGAAVAGVGVAAYAATSAAIDDTWLDGGIGDWLYDQLHPEDEANICEMAGGDAGRKKQGKEKAQKKRSKKGWYDNGNTRRPKEKKKHTPGRGHRKY